MLASGATGTSGYSALIGMAAPFDAGVLGSVTHPRYSTFAIKLSPVSEASMLGIHLAIAEYSSNVPLQHAVEQAVHRRGHQRTHVQAPLFLSRGRRCT